MSDQKIRTGLQSGRFLKSLAVCDGDPYAAQEYAVSSHWLGADVLKDALGAVTTNDEGYSARQVQRDFVSLVYPQSILGKLPKVRKVPFQLLTLQQLSHAGTYWVREQGATPITLLPATADPVEDFKAAIKAYNGSLLSAAWVMHPDVAANLALRGDPFNKLTVLGGEIIGKGFAEGGFTGSGGKFDPAGIVHAGEYVFNAQRVREIGLNNLQRLDQMGGFSEGGYVGRSGVSGSVASLSSGASTGELKLNIQTHTSKPLTFEESTTPTGERLLIVKEAVKMVAASMGKPIMKETSPFGSQPYYCIFRLTKTLMHLELTAIVESYR